MSQLPLNPEFVKVANLAEVTGISGVTAKRYRLSGIWIEGIHWIRVNSRLVLYNLPLIRDWFSSRYNPEAHQKSIEAYLQSLPSNQPQKRGRKTT
jgi:tRNA(His) 5'-end guanylyltransferase